ncbi:MAG: type II toxin-antitoxin system PemK/MazF family toxin [Rubrivivax sp.]|jgi:mRNA interferase MazF
MSAPTVTFDAFEVVRVPFPFTDRDASKNRPALVLSSADSFGQPCGHSVLAMITSAGNPPWPLDCLFGDLVSAGLPSPSVVRSKLFTPDHRLVRGHLGRLAPPDEDVVRRAMRAVFGWA